MAGRKIGVGFNAPLVLNGRCQHDWRRWYDLARRLTRLRANRKPWMKLPVSVVEAMREYRR
jgi:hypothetical protein